jgi:hypothetical protein
MADLGTGPLTAAGARDFFVARYASSGAAQKLQLGTGPGDDELASVACAGAAGCFVGGTLKGPIAFGGGVFDAGAQGAAFIARVDSSGVGAWLQLDSADGGASSITRVRARGGDAGFALVVTGSFTGELSAAGTHVDDSSGRRGFVLALDEGLGVHGQASASIACDLSDFSDVGFDGAGAAIIFGTMHGDLGCKVGGGPGGSPFDMPTGTGFFVNIDAPGFLSSGNSVSVVPVGADFTVHGAYARNSVVMAYTRGSAGSGAASLFLEGRPSVDVTAFESVATTVAAAPGGRVYAAFSYRGEMGNTLDFGTPLPARSSLSPLVFSRLPGMSADWHRTFFAEGGDAFVRAGAVSADDAYVAAGDFSGSFGTDAQLLRTDGGSDLFLLKLR